MTQADVTPGASRAPASRPRSPTASPTASRTTLAGTRYSSIHTQAYGRLRPALGLPAREPVVVDLSQGLAHVDDDLLDLLDVDVRGVGPRTPHAWKRVDVRDGAYERFVDEWGVQRSRPDGGLFFEATSRR